MQQMCSFIVLGGPKTSQFPFTGNRCALKHRQGWQNDLLRALRRDRHCIMRWTPLFPREGRPSIVLGQRRQDVLAEDYPAKWRSADPPPARSLRLWSTTLTLNFCGVREVTFPEWGAETWLGLLPTAAPRPVSSMGKCQALGVMLQWNR